MIEETLRDPTYLERARSSPRAPVEDEELDDQ